MKKIEQWLKEYSHIDSGIFYDDEKMKFIAVTYVDGVGVLKAEGETIHEAIIQWEKTYKKDFE